MLPRNLIIAGAVATLTLAACDTQTYDPNDPNRNTRQGAIAGALGGAVIGAATGRGSRADDILIGAAVGGAGGAAVGSVLDRQARDLRGSMSNNVDIINTGSELVVRMPNAILFPVDSAQVSGQSQSDLYALAQNLNQYPNSTVTVVGHTDNTGSAAYNQTLSERRAMSVASVLRGAGVSGGRIRAVGAGENQPIASNLSEAGRSQNRRVEITITPNG